MTKISDLVTRTADVAEQTIGEKGGRKAIRDRRIIYCIRCDF